jgi:spoIIIJ-associated protein
MSEKKEFHATTVEEAVSKASADLGISLDRLRFEVLDQGSTGFLGIGARDARILVEPLDVSVDIGEPQSPNNLIGDFASEDFVAPGSEVDEVDAGVEEHSAEVARGGSAELIVSVDKFMTSLVDKMGLDATVDTYDAGEVISADIATEETGLFIGRKGETIDAVQYLVNVVIYKNRPFTKRIVVDSEGYRQRRVEALQGMAHRTARRAMREKRSLSLPPMAAAERRTVHLFLKENPNVTTSSEGEEENRRVVISPV